MHKLLILLSAWLCLAAGAWAADTYTLTDGQSLTGDIVKFDDYEVMIHTSEDTFTNITWPRFSQDTLKQFAANPKYRLLASPFIQPTAADEPAPEVIPTKHVQPVKLPANPSVIGGMVHSSLGLFILLIVYAANLYAAFEVAVVRGKPIAAVMGLSAVLPIAGPAIFILQAPGAAETEEAPVEPMPDDGGPPVGPGAAPAEATAAGPAPAHEEIHIVSASWQPSQEERKPQPQVFSRGKFTLNKRFIETKFANYIGEPKGDAKNFNMEIKTLKDTLAVECIKQTGPTEAILETAHGQITVNYGDIQEIKLIPKPA